MIGFDSLVSLINTGAVPGRLNTMRLSPCIQFDSVIAARRVHLPFESAQLPSPGVLSAVSASLVTVNVALAATKAATAVGGAKSTVASEAASADCRSTASTQPSPL